MTGFEEVKKLKELEQKASRPVWYARETTKTEAVSPKYFSHMRIGSTEDDRVFLADQGEKADLDLTIALRNAAPLLLDIAGQIHFGDDKLLARLIYEQEDLARFVAGFGGVHQSERVMIDLLKRYQKMAERMHENRTE